MVAESGGQTITLLRSSLLTWPGVETVQKEPIARLEAAHALERAVHDLAHPAPKPAPAPALSRRPYAPHSGPGSPNWPAPQAAASTRQTLAAASPATAKTAA
jgi:hypothetical protein